MWVGTTFSYWCKKDKLFNVSLTHGVKYKTAECVSFGDIKPWWDISRVGDSCQPDIIRKYLLYFIKTCGLLDT